MARILQHLDPAEALGSCALVSSTWRKSAALSIRAISTRTCTQPKATALSDWLQAYAVDGGSLTSINVSNRTYANPPAQLLLPLARLPALQSLQVSEMRVCAPGGDETAPVLDAALSCLTCLQLTQNMHPMSLRGLPTLTALQRLHLDVKGSSAGDAAELADALPRLAHLTALHLRAHLTADACLTGLSSLTNLQALNLRDFRCTTASFAARLPASLTSLALAGPGGAVTPAEDAQDEDEGLPAFVLDLGSTPGIAGLTSLEALTVRVHHTRQVELHVAVLAALTRLTRLEGRFCPVMHALANPHSQP